MGLRKQGKELEQNIQSPFMGFAIKEKKTSSWRVLGVKIELVGARIHVDKTNPVEKAKCMIRYREMMITVPVSWNTQEGTRTQGGVGLTQEYGEFIPKNRRQSGANSSGPGRLVTVVVGRAGVFSRLLLFSQ